MPEKNVHVVSHTHWDREWYMPFELHRRRLVKLLDSLLDPGARVTFFAAPEEGGVRRGVRCPASAEHQLRYLLETASLEHIESKRGVIGGAYFRGTMAAHSTRPEIIAHDAELAVSFLLENAEPD